MKRALRFSQLKQSMHYYRGVPAEINRRFLQRKVDAAFISSINSKRCLNPKLGIIAKKEVRSVLVIPAATTTKDSESATSNILASILGTQGEILIGDKALRYALEHTNYQDLALLWYKKYHLPFVFATLCMNKRTPFLLQLEKRFYRHSEHIKLPNYILQVASTRTQIPKKEILAYLQLISYTIDTKSKKSLTKFLNKAKLKNQSNKIGV